MRLSLLLLLLSCLACNNQERTVAHDLQAIKNILATERKAHLDKDVSLLFSNGTDPVLDVSRGKVKLFTTEESRQRFTNYFNSVDIVKWDDVAEPIFHFSDDSTMAAVVVQKQVIVKESTGTQTDTTVFAWTAVYRKENGKWRMVVITSTNK